MVGTHEGAELAAVVIGSHEQVTLVLVRVLAGRLGGSCKALEIEFVCVALTVHLGHDILVVIISARRRGRGCNFSHFSGALIGHITI